MSDNRTPWQLEGPQPGGKPPKPWWRTKWLLVIPLAVALGVAGAEFMPVVFRSSTSPATSTTTTAPAVGSGYLASAGTGVFFIQWTNTGGDLHGTAHLVTPSGTAPTERLTTDTISVTGRLRGSTVVLSFNGGADEFGTFTAGGFTIDVPQRDGTLVPLTFRTATVVAYDRAVTRMRAQIASTNARVAAAQRLQAAMTTINNALATLKTTLATLGTIESKLPGLVAGVQAAVATEAADLTRTLAAEQNVLNSTPTATSLCTAADSVRTDADVVRTDADGVRTAADVVERSLTTSSTGLHQIMGNITPEVQALQSDESQAPQYHPGGVPSSSTIQHALATATSDGSSTTASVNALIAQANTDMAAAFSAATQALARNSCGAVSATAPLTPIAW